MSTTATLRTTLLPLGLLACLAAAQAQTFELPPQATILPGDPVALRITGLPPGTEVQVQARRPRAEWGPAVVFQSAARFVADAQGTVDLGRDAPRNGSSYEGADLRGLFWSMQPTPESAPADWPQNQVRLQAQVDGKPPVQAQLTLIGQRPDLRSVPAEGFPGAMLYRPNDDAERPAIIMLGGSEGGSMSSRRAAGLWASQGYAVLALPYYSPAVWAPDDKGQPRPQPPELPALPASFVDIPVDRLDAARAWLQAQPGIAKDRIGLFGGSKGAEFALIAATRMPWVKAVVAYVPTDVVWEGWGPDAPTPGLRSSFSWKGEALPFVPYRDMASEMQALMRGGEARLRRMHDGGRAEHPQRVAAARIPVEHYKGPLLLVGGGDDQMWASGDMAQRIADTRRAAGLPTVLKVYPEAGHAITAPGWGPTTTTNAGPMKMGGQPTADARAQADAFEATRLFLQQHL
ncbi:MAG: acyl-CoA thioester hydrolase/BAAT C-terminal domain-containing protein [Pseudomonadota bacterium]